MQPAELALPLRRAREALPAEFNKKRKANDHFLAQVMDKPKLFVMGDRDELERSAI